MDEVGGSSVAVESDAYEVADLTGQAMELPGAEHLWAFPLTVGGSARLAEACKG